MTDPLPFVPYGDALTGLPHVFVDGLRTPDTVLELSHWPGNRTPPHLRRDVSTQCVLALLASPDADELVANARAVTCDHYDVDGLLAVWALTSPDRAMELRQLVEDVAVVGDFERYVTDDAVRACLALYCAEEEVAADLRPVITAANTEDVTGLLFQRMLATTERCLTEPERWRDGWEDRWQRVVASMRLLDREPALIDHQVDPELAVVRGVDPLDIYAVHAHTDRTLIAESTPDRRHQLRFRYESFVDLQSAVVPPRIRGEILAQELNVVESHGTWMCEPPDTATPCLQLYSPSGAPASSCLTFDAFLEMVAGFCRKARERDALRWHPDADWYVTAPVAPPSGWSS